MHANTAEWRGRANYFTFEGHQIAYWTDGEGPPSCLSMVSQPAHGIGNLCGKSFSEVFGPDTQPSEAELDSFWEFINEHDGNLIFHKLLHYIADRREHEARWVGALEHSQARIGLINGALDPVSGEHAYRKWRDVLPNARHHLLPKIGHYPQVEAPDEVAAKVLEWLAETPRPIRAKSRRAVRGS